MGAYITAGLIVSSVASSASSAVWHPEERNMIVWSKRSISIFSASEIADFLRSEESKALNEESDLAGRNRLIKWKFVVRVRERTESIIAPMFNSLQEDAVCPHATGVNTAGQALAAAECLSL